jgi:hypothetical protein
LLTIGPRFVIVSVNGIDELSKFANGGQVAIEKRQQSGELGSPPTHDPISTQVVGTVSLVVSGFGIDGSGHVSNVTEVSVVVVSPSFTYHVIPTPVNPADDTQAILPEKRAVVVASLTMSTRLRAGSGMQPHGFPSHGPEGMMSSPPAADHCSVLVYDVRVILPTCGWPGAERVNVPVRVSEYRLVYDAPHGSMVVDVLTLLIVSVMTAGAHASHSAQSCHPGWSQQQSSAAASTVTARLRTP